MKGISNRQKPAWLPVRKSGKKNPSPPGYNHPDWKKKRGEGSKKSA
ncbi:MAG: hypothetical protein N3G18_08945 [Candidatus Saccharicenans sp.]|nr:hypothetical protein [Candidatus Saccharicenans sp.]